MAVWLESRVTPRPASLYFARSRLNDSSTDGFRFARIIKFARPAAHRHGLVTSYKKRQEEDVLALLAAWPDIEESLVEQEERAELAAAVREAFRVEVIPGGFSHDYVLFFDVRHRVARAAAARVDKSHDLYKLVKEHTPGVGMVSATVRMVDSRKPVEGEVCPRVMQTPSSAPLLEDLPERKPASDVPLVDRDGYWLTPIEVPFYDALRDTGLVFAVQPWVQGVDRRYRPDFVVYWNGKAVVVELDGHDGHKTKEQRRYDAERDRWFKSKGMSTVRWTGSDVYADAQSCVSELLDFLRQSGARA